MEYQELEDVYEFHRNMRRTPWTRLFPHWWDDRDALLTAVGDEVERIKAISVFSLLNQGIKPPVLLWQESINHKEYHANFNTTSLPYSASIQSPLYKTWGKITLTSNSTKDLDGLIIKLDDTHGYVINQLIAESDKIVINLTDDKITLNNHVITPQKIGKGIPYFVTQRNNEEYDENTPLHNEVIRIQLESPKNTETECDIDIDVELDEVVFTDEQNIEITGLEAVPIDRVELYAKYDFNFNKGYNGWHKVYEKKYDNKTNVVYDMITTQIYTKEFYVDVYFKTLQYPYQVGFPCYKDAHEDSKYHVNTKLDTWGEQLGLERRLYKEDIDEKEYSNTYPIYYPFDIEQDYWYYRRLTSEYAWNDLAQNDVNLLDTNNEPILRLHAIDPFIEDLVVHAKSTYPVDKEFTNYNDYNPVAIFQRSVEGIGRQTEYSNIINLLSNTPQKTTLTLNNKTDNNDVIYKRTQYINNKETAEEANKRYYYDLTEAEKNIIMNSTTYTQEEKEAILESKAIRSVNWTKDTTYQSTELITYFDLSTLPEDVNIDDIEVIIEAESTDNKTNKYSTETTGLLIPDYKGDEKTFIQLTADKPYQLKKQLINYTNNQLNKELQAIDIDDENIIQSYQIGTFEGKIKDFVKIPFSFKENYVDVTDITDVWVYYNNSIRKASYKEENGETFIYAYVPNISIIDKITIVCKSKNHYPFTCQINVSRANKYDEETNEVLYQYIQGPLVDGEIDVYNNTIEWHTNDIRNLIQKQGIYFRNVIKNMDEQSSTTIHLYNIKIKVSYSQKKANFIMSTYIDRNEAESPYIGVYHLSMSNIGDKTLDSHVDIITPPNIKLDNNHINVNIQPGHSFSLDGSQGIKILPNYPIDDGFYDIVTICEDIVKRDTIEVFSDGLISAPVTIYPHHCRYNNRVVLKANVTPNDGSIINNNIAQMQFYINGYSVGKATIVDNQAKLSILPSSDTLPFITTGILPLEAKFLGTTKYAPSSKQTEIFISKEDTRITLQANEIIPYKNSYTLQAIVEYYDGKHYVPVDDGSVEFYIDDEILSNNTTLNDGVFVSTIKQVENPAGKYTLYAKYSGSNVYAATETSMPVKIVGGNVEITIPNITAKPQDTIQLKAQIMDMNNEYVTDCYIDFYIKDKNGNYIDFNLPNFNELTKNIDIQNGIAISSDIPLNEQLDSDLSTNKYYIEARYHYSVTDNVADTSLYQVSKQDGVLNIQKGEIVLEYQPVFYGTQYEPLGFNITVKDNKTNELVSNGRIKLLLKGEDVTLEETIDSDGMARLLYQSLEFSAKEWNELEKFSFDVKGDDLYKTYSGENKNIYVDFLYNQNDGTLHYVGNKVNDTIDDLSNIYFDADTGKYCINNNPLTERDVSEHIYITDGHLYARTTKDILRQYAVGLQDIEIQYISDGQYKNKTEYVNNGLNINMPITDLDIHSYDLYYTDNENITCYVTNYHFTDDGVENDVINDGSVLFMVDNDTIDTINIVDGKTRLNSKMLSTIGAGRHLLKVKYVKDNQSPTYSYSILNLNKQKPPISINVPEIIPNKLAKVYVYFDMEIPEDVSLTGTINLFLNDKLVGNQFLNGTELIPGIVNTAKQSPSGKEKEFYILGATFDIIIPEDIDVSQYTLTASYDGNEFYLPTNNFNNPFILNKTKLDIDINVKEDIYVANEEICSIDVYVTHKDDIINEGEIVLTYGEDEVASGNVIDNKAILSWVATPIPSNNEENTDTTTVCSSYDITYRNAKNYNNGTKIINIHVIDALDTISIPNEQQENIYDALICLQPGGTIYVTDDILLTKTIEINKDCSIIGENGSSLIKDVTDLLTDYDNIYTHDMEYVKDMHVINGLSLINLNTTDFAYTDQQLYVKTQGQYIPIFLAEDGLFYSQTVLQSHSILSEVNLTINENVDVNIDNLIFKSNDSTMADFTIYNKGTCSITHSIIESTAKIYNKGTLTAHRNLIYGVCQGESDLDNNWWGSNIPPYDVNNHIILQVSSNSKPAVIGEEVQIIGKLIGANDIFYDIPQPNFKFTADTGYFSIDTGKFTNNTIITTYLDAEKEGNIYLNVDNETVVCPIYDYENKTEIIIEDIEEVIMNYQMSITAKVQSCADVYYEFDKNNNIIKSTTTINEGHLTFYIIDDNGNRQQIGYTNVINGEGTIQVFFTDLVYEVNKTYNIEVNYHTDGDYFDASAITSIKTINEDDICFVSTSGDNNGDGTYGNPVSTISKALESNKNNIYLLNGQYDVEQIQVTRNVTIKRYNGKVVFNGIKSDNIFNIQNNKVVNIQGIDFINNDCTNLINNAGKLNIRKCIFYKNKGILFNNTPSSTFSISLSAIVDNEKISENIVSENYSKCWFGQNNPQDFDNYVIMEHVSSKEHIYTGTVACITATLTSYIDNGTQYPLEDKLPLRIAQFATEIGSSKPLKDYTYNNKSTSLIDTLDDNNSSQYMITLDNNVYYEQHNVVLKCYVQDIFGNNAQKTNHNTLQIKVQSNHIDIDEEVSIIDGVAECNLFALPLGRYSLKCFYVNKQIYTLSTYFDVKPLDIVVESYNIDNKSHLYYTEIEANVYDNFGNSIDSEDVHISIDGTYIKTSKIINSQIKDKIYYDLLTIGEHIISIDNKGINTEYDTFEYQIPMFSRTQKTTINFDYDAIEADISNNLIIEINDEEGTEVQTGKVDVIFDDNIIREGLQVINGVAIIKNFKVTKRGQHSIGIYYSDINGYYEDSIKINSALGVGVFHVTCSISDNDIINAEIGKNFNMEITIQDKGYQPVNEGFVNVYIDGGLFVEKINVVNGIINFSKPLPDSIAAGTHNFNIKYFGSDKYLDTLIYAFLNIAKINTEIDVDMISGQSGQQTTVDYTVNSSYGTVNTGYISVFFDNNEEEIFLNSSPIIDALSNQITFTLPLVKAGNNYKIIFRYHDNDGNYADSYQIIRPIIDKSRVNIIPSRTWYYPQKSFNLNIDIKDKNQNIVDEGNIDVYIDGVKEYENIKVFNGQAIIPDIVFNNARDYSLKIIYKENDYYDETPFTQTFNVNNLTINKEKVTFRNELISEQNTVFINELLFNLEDYTVKDGIVDVLLDDSLVGSYYMAENNTYIQFNVGNKKGDHKLTIKYHDSTLFYDFEKDFTLTVASKIVDLRINRNNIDSQNIEALSTDTILIKTEFGVISENEWMPQPITGIVKYYLKIPQYEVNELGEYNIKDYYHRYIGLEEFNDEYTHETPFKYLLTTDLLSYMKDTFENQYIISAKFIGNTEYEPTEEQVYLNIYKQDVFLSLPQEMSFEYQDKAQIEVTMTDINNNYIIGEEKVDIIINNKFVGECTLIDGSGIFKYKLDNDYIAGSYEVKAIFNGSAVNKEASQNATFTVTPYTPVLKTSVIETNIGGECVLDGIIYDKNNNPIDEGEIEYTILPFENQSNTILSQPNKKHIIKLPDNLTSSSQITVQYTSGNISKYNDFNTNIDISVFKNPITLSIYAPNRVYRGTPFDVTIKATASNTSIPINLTFKHDNKTYNMQNGTLTTSMVYSTELDEDTIINDRITTEGNDYFEGGYVDLKLGFKNYDEITVDKTIPTSATNTHTLNQAINLVSDYGTIQINSSINEESIQLNKSVTIKGNAELIDCSITNLNKKLTIEGLTFTSTDDSKITKRYINNESILEAKDCIFKKAPKGAIYTDGSATIINCTFKDNRADNGACIYVANKNYKTSITNCQFNKNNAELYGGCIYSNKVNDIEILNNEFTYNNNATNGGSCIYGYGNMEIFSNSFYGNIGNNQIYLLNGSFVVENNLFEGNIQSIYVYTQQDLEIDADFNYWGYDNVEDIELNNSYININNYLLGDYEISEDNKYITYRINRYINSLEKEVITINTLEKTFLNKNNIEGE